MTVTSQNHTVLADNASAALAMCIKLMSTLASTSFERSMKKSWIGAEGSENIQAIQEKQTSNLINMRDWHFKGEYENIVSYLETLQKEKNIALRKSESKGLVRTLSEDEYVMLDLFIGRVSTDYRAIGKMQRAQFEFHNSIRAIMDYMLTQDTLENGTGHDALDVMIQSLLETKSRSFFEQGFVTDLFVIDRVLLGKDSGNIRYIGCKRDYLSTRNYTDNERPSENSESFEYFKVA